VHVVRFVLLDPAARNVSIVGTFNDWTRGATPLARSEQGVWTVSVPLPAGRHEYAFIVQDAAGERWVADPFATPVRDEFNTESSVVVLGAGTTRARPDAS
jgi:1,4-alpha-glucan branching enzyme